MSHYTLTAIGTDRPGIVAAVTEPLTRLHCNVEDTACSILRGHFAMMLILNAPEPLSAEELQQAVKRNVQPLGVHITVAPIDDDNPFHAPPSHVLSVYGVDRPGIVSTVSRHLADLGVNITDLQTRLVQAGTTPIYSMILELLFPAGLTADRLAHELQQLGQQMGVEVNLRELDSDTL